MLHLEHFSTLSVCREMKKPENCCSKATVCGHGLRPSSPAGRVEELWTAVLETELQMQKDLLKDGSNFTRGKDHGEVRVL